MKTHFSPTPVQDDIEQAPCGTWLGDASGLSGEWTNVDCQLCHKRKEKIIGSAAAEERAIIEQMGDMANFMRATSAEPANKESAQ